MISIDIFGDDLKGFRVYFTDEMVLDDIDQVLGVVKNRIIKISNRLESLRKYDEDKQFKKKQKPEYVQKKDG